MTQSPKSSTKLLQDILSRIQAATSLSKKSLVVFDLDSTLFDVSPRIQRILHEFANDSKFKKQFPENCQILKTIETLPSDWGIREALIRAGLDGHHPGFHDALKDFWLTRFFSNEYLEYDIPYEGACEYVQNLHMSGAEIVYLTGRDIPRMGAGTAKVLKKWKFPLSEKPNIASKQLALKPEKGMDDALFKVEYFSKIPNNTYSNIWFFENEPVNVNLVRNYHDHIEIVFFDSTHAGLASPPADLPKIMHYLLD